MARDIARRIPGAELVVLKAWAIFPTSSSRKNSTRQCCSSSNTRRSIRGQKRSPSSPASGIGKSAALALLKDGYHVGLVGRRKTCWKTAAESGAKGRAMVLAADITKDAEVKIHSMK